MTKAEVERFMKRIKSYYDTFTWDEFKLSEWYSKLKPYESEDVNIKFEEHLKGEMQARPPMLQYITRFLKTPEEKIQRNTNYIVNCNLCGQEITLTDYDMHYDKCLSIKALQKWIKESNGTEVNYEELASLDRNTFERVYQKYLKNELLSWKGGKSNE